MDGRMDVFAIRMTCVYDLQRNTHDGSTQNERVQRKKSPEHKTKPYTHACRHTEHRRIIKNIYAFTFMCVLFLKSQWESDKNDENRRN